MLATVAALVVGKAVITANAMAFLKIFDRAPLIQPILFKTAIYWVATFVTRLVERFMHFSVVDGNGPSGFATYLISGFSWQRFSAISLWILVLFLIYVTASELSQLLGPAEMRRLLFTYRPSELQSNKRQRARELMRLNGSRTNMKSKSFATPVALHTTSSLKSLSGSRGRHDRAEKASLGEAWKPPRTSATWSMKPTTSICNAGSRSSPLSPPWDSSCSRAPMPSCASPRSSPGGMS